MHQYHHSSIELSTSLLVFFMREQDMENTKHKAKQTNSYQHKTFVKKNTIKTSKPTQVFRVQTLSSKSSNFSISSSSSSKP